MPERRGGGAVLARLDEILVGHVAGRERHRVQLGHIPAGEDMAPGGRVLLEAADQGLDLVDRAAIGGAPIHPLRAVDTAEIAPFRGEGFVGDDPRLEVVAADLLSGGAPIFVERPIGPDVDALSDERTDVGVAREEPEQLLDGRLPEDALGGEERHRSVGKIEAHGGAEQRARADAGPVAPLRAARPDVPDQIKILLLGMRIGGG
jgi:hypothetical protein